MPFTIPNNAAAAFPPQAAPDSVDVDALVAAHGGTGVLSGCAVTAQGTPNMTVAVAAGSVTVGGVVAAVTAGNATITAADAANARFDLVTATNAGVKTVVTGTPAANPVFPALPATSALLAAVYVPANDTAVNANQITDKRVLLAGIAGNNWINVRDYGAVGDGSTSDTAAFAAAIAAAPAGGGCVYIPPGTYNANVVLTSRSDLTLRGSGNGTILAPASGVAIAITTCLRLTVRDLAVSGGTRGLSVSSAFDSFFNNLYFAGCTTNGVYIQGDDGMEQHYTNVIMRGCGSATTAAFEYQRTTTTDAGGLYLTDVHALYGGQGQNGFKFASSAGGTTAIFLWMQTCIADSYSAGPALTFNNVSNVTVDTSWFSGIVPALGIVQIAGAYLFRFSNTHLVQVDATGFCLEFVGNVTESFFDNVAFDAGAATTAIKTSATQYNTYFGPYHSYPTTLADNYVNLMRRTSNGIMRLGPTRLYTRGGGTADDTLALVDTDAQTVRKFLRNNAGALEVVNDAYTTALLSLSDAGALTVSGAVAATNIAPTPIDGYLLAQPAIVAGLTAVTTTVTNTTYFQYLGRAQAALTACSVIGRVTTAPTGTITWLEVGIFKGASTAGTAASLTRVGFANAAATWNSTGVKITAVTLSGVTAGDELWVAYGAQSNTAQMQLRGMVADDLQTGVFQSAAGRLSTLATPVTTAVTTGTLVPAWITVRF